MFITGLLIAIVTIVGIVYSRLITTFFHELGHAIPALAFSSKQVTMYVGSYGNPDKSWTLNLGRLKMILSFNIWDLQLGLCTHSGKLSNTQSLIIIFGGPLLSLIFAGILIGQIVTSSFSDGTIFILAIFIGSSIWDFLVNIIPRSRAMKLHDGSLVFNDGMQIRNIFKRSKLPKEYSEIQTAIGEGHLQNAKDILGRVLQDYSDIQEIRELELDIADKENDYKGYISLFENLLNDFNPSTKYVISWAKAKIKMHDYDDVISILTNLILEGKNYYEFHFLRGKALIELGEYRDALIDFHALTLENKEEDTLALANRAYCQYKLEFINEAVEDIEKAIHQMKDEIAEVYFLAGQILSDRDSSKALKYYKKAEAMKYEHHALAFNIAQLEASI